MAATSAEVVFTRPSDPIAVVGDLRRTLVRDVGITAISDRLNEDAARGTVPFYDVDVEVFAPARGVRQHRAVDRC